jgi:hypothetical protein
VKKLTLYSASALLIFFLSHCKKKQKGDTTSPTVSISSPANGQSFNMFDTIIINAHVSDETQLTSVVVSLNDLNNIPVQSAVNVGIQGKDFSFTLKYILSEYHLASGNYNISISANDGSNSHQGTQQIYIHESPTLKTGYYIVGATQPKIIGKYDASFSSTGSISLNTGFNGMVYEGYYHQLFVNGNINQSFQTYNAQTNTIDWSLPYGGGGLSQFMSVYTDGKKPYISFYSGNVVSYSNTGTIDKTYNNSGSGYYATCFAIGSSFNVGVYTDKFGTGADKIMCFNKNGPGINGNFAPLSTIALFEHASDQFFVLGNDASNKAVLSIYSVSANISNPVTNLVNSKMLSAVQIDPDYLIFSCANGTIYGYKYSTSNLLSLATVSGAQKLFYQPKMLELTAASLNTLYVYSVSGNYVLTQQNMQVLTDSIIGFEVITNK